MAKENDSDNVSIEALDLISLLSMPGTESSYDIELSLPENDIDLLALGSVESPKLAAIKKGDCDSKSDNPIPVKKASQTKNLMPLVGYEADTFENILKDIFACQNCNLCQTRKNVVPGIGSQSAKLVLIGEAPGADEDEQGIPFVGKAGKHLDKILAAAGFKKEDIYICNILKCRPPNNRDPNLREMKACTGFLQRQLAIIKPKIIGCLGNIAIHYVIGPSLPGITKVRGQWFDSIFGIPTFAMYHPSYLIRSDSREKGSPNWQMWQDIRLLKARYDSLS